ncbi:MAG: 30S ribosomal protein S12 methylthiotransferase RimO [Bacteroidales bacterium]
MKKHKINIVTLGCSKNLVDSEKLATQLKGSNIEVEFDSDNSKAKSVVINTCGFIKDSKEESIDTILSYAKKRMNGKIENLYVIGCLSERYKKDLEKEIPEVDQYFGVNDLEQIVKSLKASYKEDLIGERHLSTPKHYAYLKISEGCDRGCSFCAIPLIRGKHQSVPIEILIDQAQHLANQGVKEIILIAQDLVSYGIDLYKKNRLAELLKALSKIEKIEWIRLHYTYPAGFPDEVIELIATEEKICSYVDIPLQHINDKVLRLMRRGHNRKSTLKLISRLREKIPNVVIRTTLLVGHPGEGEQEFNELKEFISDVKFDRLGVFTYSEEEGTFGALNLKDEITEEVKLARAEEIMAIQQEIALNLNSDKIGKSFKVLIDRIEGDYFVGRTEFDSPEVDNEVLIFKNGRDVMPGEFYEVFIESAKEFDLIGTIRDQQIN